MKLLDTKYGWLLNDFSLVLNATTFQYLIILVAQ